MVRRRGTTFAWEILRKLQKEREVNPFTPPSSIVILRMLIQSHSKKEGSNFLVPVTKEGKNVQQNFCFW